jgi:hypothetical protein
MSNEDGVGIGVPQQNVEAETTSRLYYKSAKAPREIRYGLPGSLSVLCSRRVVRRALSPRRWCGAAQAR